MVAFTTKLFTLTSMDEFNKKQLLLDQIYQKYNNCLACPLAKEARTSIVFGSGNPDAKIMLIGEAPGKDEDAQGKPFVGRSGKLLTKLLNNLGIDRNNIYIANIVKCRPANNRPPTGSELATCKKLLLTKQIEIIKPTVIVTLGSSALNGLLETKLSITKVRGQLYRYLGIKLIPTLHPAYILRNMKKSCYLLQDLEQAFSLSEIK